MTHWLRISGVLDNRSLWSNNIVMSNLTCPKCGGSDSFVSQRNIVKGRGVYQSGKMRGVWVCRVCDEIMSGSNVAISPEQAMKKIRLYLLSIALITVSIVAYLII